MVWNCEEVVEGVAGYSSPPSHTVHLCDGEAAGDGKGAAPHARVAKFSLHQRFNLDETPV